MSIEFYLLRFFEIWLVLGIREFIPIQCNSHFGEILQAKFIHFQLLFVLCNPTPFLRSLSEYVNGWPLFYFLPPCSVQTDNIIIFQISYCCLSDCQG